MRDILSLPSYNTIMSYFDKIGSPGSSHDCSNTIKRVFSELTDMQKHCFVSVDEINIKPDIRYRGNHLIGQAVDVSTGEPAKKILTLMINPSLGAPAFVRRLIPVFSLKADFLFDQVISLPKTIHQCGSYVFLIMADNLFVNQKLLKIFHEKFKTKEIFAVTHPVPNLKFSVMYSLYDPVHLIKNIRNNWITEKCQKLKFYDPESGKHVIAAWGDLIKLNELESESAIRLTKLSPRALWPSNFEKQKVQLALNICNEKVFATLTFMSFNETANFVGKVERMWRIINVKSNDIGFHLNDDDRYPITDVVAKNDDIIQTDGQFGKSAKGASNDSRHK